jgi:hypothetical protein
MASSTTKKLERREFIMPTAPNILNLVHSNMVDNFRRRQNANIELPSLYRLSFMVHHNTGELLVSRGVTEET